MSANETVTGAPDFSMEWRFKVGIALFALMTLLWLLIPAEAALNMSVGAIAATTAGIVIVNNTICLLAITAMGKPGFQELRRRAFGCVKRLAPETTISSTRYTTGLVMFCIPFLHGLFVIWSTHIALHQVGHQLWVDALMNGIFVASLFMLGGNFWDKFRALFFVDARAVFSEDSNRLVPETKVSPTQYKIGLVMFCLPGLQGVTNALSTHIAPQLVGHAAWVDVLMNGMFVASVFVLGGKFWDKFRALFVVDARAVFPESASRR